MFTLLELFDDNSSSMQVFYAVLSDIIFFGSLYWGIWRTRVLAQREEIKEE